MAMSARRVDYVASKVKRHQTDKGPRKTSDKARANDHTQKQVTSKMHTCRAGSAASRAEVVAARGQGVAAAVVGQALVHVGAVRAVRGEACKIRKPEVGATREAKGESCQKGQHLRQNRPLDTQETTHLNSNIIKDDWISTKNIKQDS